ncbi:MAG: RHS repeat-associated core domain-containing protein [Xanthomonadales bacterium]|nr:RHS repeat-associated core domain-containing protein [Xanthomonadales bacterium]
MPNEDPDGDGSNFTFNPRFPGQYFDSETGLYYNYFRYYDSETGRYVTSDPIGLGGGLNTFSYSKSSPVTYYDPMGLCPQCVAIPVICAFGGCELIAGSLVIGGVVIYSMSTPIGERPDWWPDDVPHPNDPPRELSCTVSTSFDPGSDIPEPPSDCLSGYHIMLTACNKKISLGSRGACVAAATLAYIACVSFGG